eukprot:GILJ01008224.1.p1 GENE.GILJ01008224.1~~GILJ01008224.1.p1  ORF type:complete len:2318 (+),score=345.48 GILJ01008224.1:234-6956(+)
MEENAPIHAKQALLEMIEILFEEIHTDIEKVFTQDRLRRTKEAEKRTHLEQELQKQRLQAAKTASELLDQTIKPEDDANKHVDEEPVYTDVYCYQLVCLVYIVCESEPAVEAIQSNTGWLALLFGLLHTGSMRVKSLALRVLRRILVSTSVPVAMEALGRMQSMETAAAYKSDDADFATDQQGTPNLVTHMFSEISRTWRNCFRPKKSETGSYGYAAELTQTLRYLLTCPSWISVIQSVLQANLPGIYSKPGSKDHIFAAISLCVLGGQMEAVRVGAKVEYLISGTRAKGVVVSFDPIEGVGKVVEDAAGSASQPIEVRRDQFTGKVDYPLNTKSIYLNDEFVPIFEHFLHEVTEARSFGGTRSRASSVMEPNNRPGASPPMPKSDQLQTVSNEEPSSHAQIRSFAFKSLHVLLQNPAAVECLIRHSLLLPLLSKCLQPTSLKSYTSIQELEERDYRIWEYVAESSTDLGGLDGISMTLFPTYFQLNLTTAIERYDLVKLVIVQPLEPSRTGRLLAFEESMLSSDPEDNIVEGKIIFVDLCDNLSEKVANLEKRLPLAFIMVLDEKTVEAAEKVRFQVPSFFISPDDGERLKQSLSLPETNKPTVNMSLAEELSSVGFPIKFVKIALDKCNNDANAAAGWLLENMEKLSSSDPEAKRPSISGPSFHPLPSSPVIRSRTQSSVSASGFGLGTVDFSLAELDELDLVGPNGDEEIERDVEVELEPPNEIYQLDRKDAKKSAATGSTEKRETFNFVKMSEDELQQLAAETARALFVSYARRSLYVVLGQWPASIPFSVSYLGDSASFIKLFKLAAFESFSMDERRTETPPLDIISNKISGILQERIAPNQTLSQLLVQEFVVNPIQAMMQLESPAAQIRSEADALREPYAQLVCWVLDFFLKQEGPSARHIHRDVYTWKVFDLLAGFAIFVKGDLRHQVLGLMSNMLRALLQSTKGHVALINFRSKNLKRLQQRMQRLYDLETDLHSKYLQNLIEIMSLVRAAEKQQEEQQNESERHTHAHRVQDQAEKAEARRKAALNRQTSIQWLDRFVDTSKVITAMVDGKLLPEFLCEAWLQYAGDKEVVIRQSPHPYHKVYQTGRVQIPHAESLIVTFEDQSRLDGSDAIKFTYDPEGLEEATSVGGNLSKVTTVVTGDEFFYHFPYKASEVLSCGEGDSGRLGHPDLGNRASPKVIDSLRGRGIKDIACGETCSAFISEAGELLMCGKGDYGKLGFGNTDNVVFPQVIKAFQGQRVRQVSCNSTHTLAAMENGLVFSWGSGEHGKLGHGDVHNHFKPKLVEALGKRQAYCVAAGYDHSLAVVYTENKRGEVYAFGRNTCGQLGINRAGGQELSPVLVQFQENQVIKTVVAGVQTSAILSEEGAVYTWGDFSDGKLGHFPINEFVKVPRKVAGLEHKCITQIDTQRKHFAAVSADFETYTWGLNRLGHGSINNEWQPRKVDFFSDKSIISVAVGDRHSAFVSAAGEVYTCGEHDLGRLGHDVPGQQLAPKLVESLRGVRISKVALGGTHSIFLSPAENIEAARSEHTNIFCNSCGAYPIVGTRYKDMNALDFDICETCEAAGLYDPTHTFMKIRLPGINEQDTKVFPAFAFESRPTDTTDNNNDPVTHPDTMCDGCGKYPIVGIRYKAISQEDLDLCSDCEATGQHEPHQVFMKLRQPLHPSMSIPVLNVLYPKSEHWGFKFKVVANYSPYGLRLFMTRFERQFCEFQGLVDYWTEAMDEQLVDMVNQKAEKEKSDPLTWKPEQLQPTPDELMKFPHMESATLPSIQARFSVLKALNSRVAFLLPLLDLSTVDETWKLSHRLCLLKARIFWTVKSEIWNKVLRTTMTSEDMPRIQLDRVKASRLLLKGTPDTEFNKSLFAQAYHQLTKIDPERLRQSSRAWKAEFRGEGGEDAGGLFRESITHVCSELQSPVLPLLIPCQNQQNDMGSNREKWIINPACTSAMHMGMYQFLGKLMGIAIRSGNIMNLDLPSIVWKHMVKSPIDRADIEAVDRMCIQALDFIRDSEKQGVTADMFEDIFQESFVTNSSDGSEIELIPNGKHVAVTYANRMEYVRLVERYRFNEGKRQVEAIVKGMGTIVPIHLLAVFTWQELQLRICGKMDVDVTLLKRKTVYEGWLETDTTIDLFWKVLESFTPEERSLYLRFVWGRARLPISDVEFSKQHKIQRYECSSPDDYLPIAHTCFFSIELPRYSTFDILKNKLLFAITHCQAIDTDHTVNRDVWTEDDDPF